MRAEAGIRQMDDSFGEHLRTNNDPHITVIFSVEFLEEITHYRFHEFICNLDLCSRAEVLAPEFFRPGLVNQSREGK